MLALALLTASADPCGELAGYAAELGGWSADDMRRHAQRESRCTAIGPHAVDGALAPVFAARACAPAWWVAAWPAASWGPRGPWGAAAAYVWCALPEPARVLPPVLLDHPIIGAYLVARHHARLARVSCSSAPSNELNRCVRLARGNAASRRQWRQEYT